MSRSALLMVTESRSGKANSHSIWPLTTPRIAGWPGGGATWKWTLRWRGIRPAPSRPGKEVLRDPWRHGEDHGVFRAKRPASAVEVERDGARRPRSRIARSRSPKRTAEPRAARKASAGSMKLLASPCAANSGWQAFPPAARVSRSKAAASGGRAFRRIGVERRRSGADARAARRAGPRSRIASPTVAVLPLHEHAERGEIFAKRRCRARASSDRTATTESGPR